MGKRMVLMRNIFVCMVMVIVKIVVSVNIVLVINVWMRVFWVDM